MSSSDTPPRVRRLHVPSQTPSPLHSAPDTPTATTTITATTTTTTTKPYSTPRHPSPHPAASPLPATLPRQPSATQTLPRTSSAMALTNPPAPSVGTPKSATRRASRQSLGDEGDKRPTPKRSISNLIATLKEAQSTMEAIEEPVRLTAAQIAQQHFGRELEAHESDESDTVVILHDACYGHRYSRPKTTKSTLNMIVERPERLLAGVLGVSAAYVRLGGHHAEGRNAPAPRREREEQRPPFKIRRTGRSLDVTSPCVTNVHGTEWMRELQGMCHSAAGRLAGGRKELERPGVGYTEAEMEKRRLHEGDLYLAPESLPAFQGALGAVVDAVDAVFSRETSTNKAFVAVRPPGHHCSADQPSGFCWLNNVHVAIEYAAQSYGLTHAAILDFDLHHGDGSQQITWERNARNQVKRINAKPTSKLKLAPHIAYYSLHDINSYPCEMGDDEKVQAASLCIDNAHGQNIWNVHLQPWKTEEEFWELYESRYKVLLHKARTFLSHQADQIRRGSGAKTRPNAAIFISAGFDASEWEGAGMQRHNVNVPTEFYARLTQDVVALAQEPAAACEGRVISVLEGGYSDRALCSGVMSHLSGLCSDARPAEPTIKEEPGLDELMRGLQLAPSPAPASNYDATWWSTTNLTALEHHVNPPPLPGPGRKLKTPQPTYATPTESFAYKVVDTNKFARSISGTMRQGPENGRPVTPPAPAVDWIVATHELSKLLIPTNRTTRSCTAEGLAGPKVKKEAQQPMVPPPAGVDGSRQLRDRTKAKVPAKYAESAHSDDTESVASRSVSRASHGSRRQTLHDFPLTSEDPAQKELGRRLSAGTVLSDGAPPSSNGAPPIPAVNGGTFGNRPMKPPPAPAPRAASNALDLKKTRMPSKPRSTMPGKGSAAPSPTTSTSNVSTAASLQSSRASTPAAQLPVGSSAHATHSSAANGVDALTTGMKKITLKVGSREEHDRKQREREAADRRARALKGAETRRLAKKERERVAGQAKRKEVEIGQVPVQHAEEIKEVATEPDVPVTTITQASVGPADATTMPSVTDAIAQDAVPPAPVMDKDLMPEPDLQPSLPGPEPAQQAQPDFSPANLEDATPGASPPPTKPTTTPYPTSNYRYVPPLHQQPSSPPSRLPQSPTGSPRTAQNSRSPTSPAPPPSPPQKTANEVPDSAARQLLAENNLANALRTSTSSPVKSPSGGRRELPVWSSTGPIPFAAPPGQGMGLVPAFPSAPAPGSVWGEGRVLGSGSEGPAQGVGLASSGAWEVPDTLRGPR